MSFKRLVISIFVLTFSVLACQSTAGTLRSPTQNTVPSPAVTAPPGPTDTPLPPGPRDFTEDFDSRSPYWVAFGTNGPDPDVQIQNGYIVFNLAQSTTWAYSIYGGQHYQDVRVDAQVEIRAGNDGAAGIVCRYDESKGWYEFNIYPDQSYALLYGQWLTRGVARYTPIYLGGSDKITSGANQIGLSCKGDILTPFINNVKMRIWEEKRYGLQDGQVGISASSFVSVPFVAAYDWVKVSEP
jgi:hypothetical protein